MPVSTSRAALAAVLLGLPLAADAQPGPPPSGPPVGTVTVDGTLTDSPYTLLATDGGRTNLGFGSDNQLNALYAHVDQADGRLFIGLAGTLERNDENGNRNYAVILLDTRAGGFTDGGFGREDGPDFGNGITNFNSLNSFDVGFTADYALQIGCGGPNNNNNCFATLYTLSGTPGAGGGPQRFIGSNSDANVKVSLPPAGQQDSRTQGAEIALSFSASGVDTDIALDRNSVQAFAFITSAGGFLSDQFLSPTGTPAQDADLAPARGGNYGNETIAFETKLADPVSLVFQPIAGRAGWRQLAWPVQGGVVANYAAQNHVQGPGTAFPNGGSNVILSRGTDYTYATGSGDPLVSGRGQFWYHYDAADFPGGAVPPGSNFQARPYTLVAGGTEPQADVDLVAGEVASGFVMAGNPFALDFDTQGLAAQNGVVAGPRVFAWDPDAGTAGDYVVIDRNAPAQADRTVAPMQGFWVETLQLTTLSAARALGGGLQITYPQASRVQGGETLVARTAAQRILAFTLDRVTDAGPVREWHHTRLAFVDGATDGVDRFDGGLPPAIGPEASRIGFAATDADGRTVYRSQESRAYDVSVPVEARLALSAATAARYRLAWPTLADLPEGWTATLTDGDGSGETVDLRTTDHYDFDAAAGDWTGRFTVRIAPRAVTGEAAPATAGLGAATPNPAAGDTRLALTVDQPQRVRAELFDALGRRVALVLDAAVDAPRDLRVDVQGLAPGVYVLRVTGDTFAASRRITVAR